MWLHQQIYIKNWRTCFLNYITRQDKLKQEFSVLALCWRGLSCASLASIYQMAVVPPSPPPPNCNNQKCLQILSRVPCGGLGPLWGGLGHLQVRPAEVRYRCLDVFAQIISHTMLSLSLSPVPGWLWWSDLHERGLYYRKRHSWGIDESKWWLRYYF